MKTTLCISTSVGEITLVAQNGKLVQVLQGSSPSTTEINDQNNEVLTNAAQQIKEYFAGQRSQFALPIQYQGSDFQRAVWERMQAIPYGQTLSYGSLAGAIGREGAARAVGSACRQNPLPIVIPCHRVVRTDQHISSFLWGADIKQQLLNLESFSLTPRRI